MKTYNFNGPIDPLLELREWPDDMTRELCHIVIVNPHSTRSPAELALETEGIKCEVISVEETHSYEGDSSYAYVDLLGKLWDKGETFINLEHDVVPWPGALDELYNCDQPCCRFSYPMFPPGSRDERIFGAGIGCIKFTEEVIRNTTADSWLHLAWWELDGQIISEIKGAGYAIHEHSPDVAHVRLRPFVS